MSEVFSSSRFADLSDSYRVAVDWLGAVVPSVASGRFGQYARDLKRLLEIYESNAGHVDDEEFLHVVIALYEAQELLMVYRAFSAAQPSDRVAEKLREIVKGPVSYTKEDSSSSNRARNIMFELIMEARLRLSRFRVLDKFSSDVGCEFETKDILFECKRPRSVSAIERNVKDARDQILRQVRDIHFNRRGLVCLDAGLIINPNFHLLRASGVDSIGKEMSGLIWQFLETHRKVWQQLASKKIIAVLVRFAAMAVDGSKGGGLIYCQQYDLKPLHTHGAGYEFSRRFGQAFAEVS